MHPVFGLLQWKAEDFLLQCKSSQCGLIIVVTLSSNIKEAGQWLITHLVILLSFSFMKTISSLGIEMLHKSLTLA